jgi:CheY-like chemotaxis protein
MTSANPPVTPYPGRALKVLVAEDNIINQRLVVGLLTQLGHIGVVVSDGEKAMRCLTKMRVDLVLMDIMMPHMDGLQALAAIRAKEVSEGGHLPVIMVTAHDELGDATLCRKAGADGYLTKPLDVQRLQSEMSRVVAQR